MKTIVCFGDSNTWGAMPSGEGRYPRDVRWTGVLRNTLGADFWVIEEGLNGRTTVWNDPLEPGGYRSGMDYLRPCLWSHAPFDLITIMLGTNDLKQRFGLPPSDIAIGVGALIDVVKASGAGINGRAPEILVMCPPPVAPIQLPRFVEMFEGAEEKSKMMAAYYEVITQERDVHFLDAGQFIHSSPYDSIHFEADAHNTLGKAVAEKILSILK